MARKAGLGENMKRSKSDIKGEFNDWIINPLVILEELRRAKKTAPKTIHRQAVESSVSYEIPDKLLTEAISVVRDLIDEVVELKAAHD